MATAAVRVAVAVGAAAAAAVGVIRTYPFNPFKLSMARSCHSLAILCFLSLPLSPAHVEGHLLLDVQPATHPPTRPHARIHCCKIYCFPIYAKFLAASTVRATVNVWRLPQLNVPSCMYVYVCVLLLLYLLPHLLPDRLSVTGEISAVLFAQAVEQLNSRPASRGACHTCVLCLEC